MIIYKNRGLIYSECFLQLLNNFIDYDNLTISVQVLDNGREQGYTMRVRDDKNEGLTFYVYAHRNSGQPTITWENNLHYENMYTEQAWIERTKSCEGVEQIVDIAVGLIKERWGE